MNTNNSKRKILQEAIVAKIHSSLNYTFKNLELLELSLTHKSVSNANNEKFEFLGDSILNFTISSAIFEKFPNLDEGALTRVRSELVSRKTLAKIAKKMNLETWVILSSSEKAAGGCQRTSILANALEAIFAAVYFDSNIDTTKQVILGLYREKIEEIASSGGVAKDNKTKLQEWLQINANSLPEYHVIDVSGRQHNQVFRVECRINFLDATVVAEASSKRKAEQKAAEKMLEIIQQREM